MISAEEAGMGFREYMQHKGYPIDENQVLSMNGQEYERAIWYAKKSQRRIYEKTWAIVRAMNSLVYAGFRPIAKSVDNGHIQVRSSKGTQFNYFATTGTIMRSGKSAYCFKGMRNLIRLLNEE